MFAATVAVLVAINLASDYTVWRLVRGPTPTQVQQQVDAALKAQRAELRMQAERQNAHVCALLSAVHRTHRTQRVRHELHCFAAAKAAAHSPTSTTIVVPGPTATVTRTTHPRPTPRRSRMTHPTPTPTCSPVLAGRCLSLAVTKREGTYDPRWLRFGERR